MKKSYYSIKSVLIELILCLTKKTSSFLVQKNKYKKIIRKFQKHCESILRKCNIVRLKYIYQKKKLILFHIEINFFRQKKFNYLLKIFKIVPKVIFLVIIKLM